MSITTMQAVTTVDHDGVIRPAFIIPENENYGEIITTGYLRNFHGLEGKRVKVTVQVLED